MRRFWGGVLSDLWLEMVARPMLLDFKAESVSLAVSPQSVVASAAVIANKEPTVAADSRAVAIAHRLANDLVSLGTNHHQRSHCDHLGIKLGINQAGELTANFLLGHVPLRFGVNVIVVIPQSILKCSVRHQHVERPTPLLGNLASPVRIL